MRVELDVGYASAPPPPPPPPPHRVQAGETVQSVATVYHVAPQALAHANHITVDASLHAGQMLQLPEGAFLADTPSADGGSSTQSPQQKTDAAAKAYQQALKDRDQAMRTAPPNMGIRSEIWNSTSQQIQTARTNFDQAVKAEIANDVKQAQARALKAYQAIPPQLRRVMQAEGDPLPHVDAQQVAAQASSQIANRYKGDPTLAAESKDAGHAYQVQQKAESLIPYYGSDVSAADKLKGIDLKGQSQEVVDAVLADPRVQQWIKQAARDATTKPTTDDVKYLAELAQASPQIASKVIQQWWGSQDTQSIMVTTGAAVISATDPDVYKNLATLYNALAGTPGGEQVQQQIASTIANQQQNNPVALQRTLNQAIQDGADPKLALAVASEMEANGKHDAAQEVVGAVKAGVLGYQKITLKDDMQAYAKQTEELNQMLQNLGPGTTQEQRQKLVDAYIKGKGKDWQDQLKADKDKIIADVRRLDSDLVALKTENMPDNLKQFGISDDAFRQLGDDETTRQAVQFVAEQDPGVFGGEEGGEAAKLWVEIGHKSKDFVEAMGKAYVAGNVLPSLSHINPNDPASVAKARQTLEDFRGTASKMLGIPQGEVDKGIDKLESVLTSLKSESIEDAMAGKGINALGATEKELNGLKELVFSNEGAGLAFRSLAFGITGAALINQTGKTIDDPSVQNILGTAAFALDLAPSKTAFTSTIQALDKNGVLERWGVGAAGLTEKFIGVINIAYFAAGAVNGFEKGDYPTAIFSTIGVGGAALATFGGEEILGGLAGPIGIAIATVAVVALGLIEGHNDKRAMQEDEAKYLKASGMDDETAEALAKSDPDQLKQLQATGMTPEQIQELGKDYPQLLQSEHYGNPYVGDWPKLLQRTGMSGTDLFNMLKAADEGGTPGAGIAELSYVLGHPNFFPQVAGAQSKAELVTALQGVEKQLDGLPDSKDQVQALQQAVAWLQSH